MGVSRNSGLWGERAGMILRKFRSTASIFLNQNANYSSAFTEYCHLYRINILRYILSCIGNCATISLIIIRNDQK